MQISTSKKRITPEGRFLPCYLCGHAIRTDIGKGVADELFTEAMVLIVDHQTLIFVSFDLIGMDRSVNENLRKELSEKYHVPYENINIGFVHTHSAPEYSKDGIFGGATKAVPGYMDYVVEQIKAAVDECMNSKFKEVKAYYKNTLIDGFYSNRNGLDKVGDNNITLVTFEEENGNVAGGFLNFTCHSTVLGPQNYFVSGDLAGYLNREFQIRYGVAPITMIGAAGDMSNRQLRQGNDYAELKRVGDGIMAQIDANTQHDELNIEHLTVQKVDYYKTYQLDVEKKKQQIETIKERLANAKTFDETKVYTSALAGAEKSLNHTEGTMDCKCVLYKMDDLYICTIPAELFSCFGLEIKKEMNVKCPIVWGYSNYSVGYLADIKEYGSSFETAASEIPVGTTEEIIGQIIDYIHKI